MDTFLDPKLAKRKQKQKQKPPSKVTSKCEDLVKIMKLTKTMKDPVKY